MGAISPLVGSPAYRPGGSSVSDARPWTALVGLDPRGELHGDLTYDDVLRFVQRRVHSSHVEDVAADAYLIAGRRLEDLPGDHGKSGAWLFGSPDRTQPSPQGLRNACPVDDKGMLGNSRPTRAPGGGARQARSPQNTEAWDCRGHRSR